MVSIHILVNLLPLPVIVRFQSLVGLVGKVPLSNSGQELGHKSVEGRLFDKLVKVTQSHDLPRYVNVRVANWLNCPKIGPT